MRTSNENAIPSSISNRRLIQQMELWGWSKGRKRGDRVEMILHDSKVTVMAEQIHKKNSSSTLRTVYDLTTMGNAAAFWQYRAPSNVPTGEELTNQFGPASDPKTGADFFENAVILCTKCDKYHRADHPCPTPTESTQSVPAPEPASDGLEKLRKNRVIENRGMAATILEAMAATPHKSFTARTLATVFPGASSDAINGAMAYLYSKGHVVRVMRGTYRLNDKLAAERTVHHAHTGPLDVAVRAADPAPVAPAPQPPAPEPEWRQSNEPIRRATNEEFALVDAAMDNGDDLDALLELILPDNYHFKPAHLTAMRRWQNETARLLAALRS